MADNGKAFFAEGSRAIVLADLDKDAIGCDPGVADYVHRKGDGVDRGLKGIHRVPSPSR